MSLTPQVLSLGSEQFESFKAKLRGRYLVQYDYRHVDGELFSCVKDTLEECRKARDLWLRKRYRVAI